jgi:release factor glutamine methyltransferase
MTGATLGAVLKAAGERIGAVDARVLLGHVLDRDSAYLAAHPEALLRARDIARFEALVERRVGGEPVAYLTGRREFYGRFFRASPAVLIPRPETELLVDLALERLPRDAAGHVLDLGTGSGCVAISIASERSRLKILAIDQSLEALALARHNALDLGVGNVVFLQSDWFSALAADERFDVIVANPPYVATGDPHLEDGDLRFEPRVALTAGTDGLDAIRTIVRGAGPHLSARGWLLLEHGYRHAEPVRRLLRDAGYGNVFSDTDIAGIERVTGGRLTVVDVDR